VGYHPSNLGRVSLAKQSGWGTKQTSFAASTYAECEITTPTLSREALMTEAYRGSYYAHRVSAGSKDGATASIRMPLHGWSATTPSGDPTSSNQNVDSILFEYVLGGTDFTEAVQGKTVDSYSAPTVTASGAPTSCAADAVLVQTGAGGTAYAVGWVKTAASADLTMTSNLSAVGLPDGALFGSISHYLSSGQPSVPLSMEFIGADASSRIILFDGLVTSVTLTMDAKAQPMLEAQLTFADWEFMGSGGNPGLYTYSLPQLPASTGTTGALVRSDGTAVDVASMSVEFTAEYKAVLNHSSSEGVSRYVVTSRNVNMSMEVLVGTVGATEIKAPGDEYAYLQADLNTATPGAAFSMLIPVGQINEQSTLGDSEGIVSVSHSISPGYYSADTGTGDGSTNAIDTPCRVAFL
jgi:hypothetical protein